MFSEPEKRRFQMLQNKWNRIDTLIIGLGSVEKAKEHYYEEFENLTFFQEVSENMKGEILGNFFSEKSCYYFSGSNRISSLELENVQSIKNTICIAHGKSDGNDDTGNLQIKKQSKMMLKCHEL